MERIGITTQVYQRVKRYWQPRRCVRLGGNNKAGLNRPRRIRIKLKKKLKLRYYSPKSLLTRLRDAYVNIMMRMANSPMLAGTGGYGEEVDEFGMRLVKEYHDERLMVQMYKMPIF
ncbi:uncharacterized protein LOC143623306 [Bidens hawaiensis]|uniref:uncharacterized protein LOC143623306 n=1 Tax=Bidens hawaiensis TaxID=980011 RepID=UPI00404A76F7